MSSPEKGGKRPIVTLRGAITMGAVIVAGAGFGEVVARVTEDNKPSRQPVPANTSPVPMSKTPETPSQPKGSSKDNTYYPENTPLRPSKGCDRAMIDYLAKLADRTRDGKLVEATVRSPKEDDPEVKFDGVEASDVNGKVAEAIWNPIVHTCDGDGETNTEKEYAYLGIVDTDSNQTAAFSLDAPLSVLKGESELKTVTLRYSNERGAFVGNDDKLYGMVDLNGASIPKGEGGESPSPNSSPEATAPA